MNKTQVRVIAFAAIFTLFNCGANEESPSPEIIPDPDINVGQFEVSEFIYNGALESDEFEATFGDETITVYKSGENTLAYSVPLLEPGVYELNIPSLNHQVYVSVSETVLTETPEEILDGLENTFSSYTSALPDDDVDKGMISSVNSAFSEMLKNASIEEKKQLALYYQANKKVFDALLNPNYDNTDGRIADCVFCTAANLKFGYSLLVFGSGVAVAWLGKSVV